MVASFASSSVGSCSAPEAVVVNAIGFGGDTLGRLMKPMPGREMLVADGIGNEAKNEEPVSTTEIVRRRRDNVPSAGSNVRRS